MKYKNLNILREYYKTHGSIIGHLTTVFADQFETYSIGEQLQKSFNVDRNFSISPTYGSDATIDEVREFITESYNSYLAWISNAENKQYGWVAHPMNEVVGVMENGDYDTWGFGLSAVHYATPEYSYGRVSAWEIVAELGLANINSAYTFSSDLAGIEQMIADGCSDDEILEKYTSIKTKTTIPQSAATTDPVALDLMIECQELLQRTPMTEKQFIESDEYIATKSHYQIMGEVEDSELVPKIAKFVDRSYEYTLIGEEIIDAVMKGYTPDHDPMVIPLEPITITPNRCDLDDDIEETPDHDALVRIRQKVIKLTKLM